MEITANISKAGEAEESRVCKCVCGSTLTVVDVKQGMGNSEMQMPQIAITVVSLLRSPLSC